MTGDSIAQKMGPRLVARTPFLHVDQWPVRFTRGGTPLGAYRLASWTFIVSTSM